ncbi:MAG TPA: Nramp family divalent metal transporter [Chloroflexota bacterium]|nr:Nramp family divalent metal transporter [Chloroflexota bacterium]
MSARAYRSLEPASISDLAPEDVALNAAAHVALSGGGPGLLRLLPFFGPAFIASVAYIDPGNFATNIQGGSQFGYRLLWAIVMANLMAMLIQTLSAKLGIATGRNLAELVGEHFSKGLVYPMWAFSEVAAMATDLAEFLGATLGLNLLFHIDLRIGVIITAIATYGILMLQRYGVRPIEAIISAMVGVIAASYVIETFFSRPNLGLVAYHSVVPYLGGSSVIPVVGIIGATVMPHVVYLHSALTQNRIIPRTEQEARRIFHFTIPEILIALGLAGLINMSMLYMAAATFYQHHLTRIADIPSAFHTLTPLLGPAAGIVFAISLLASGLSSSAVGTMAGQIIMQGFVGFTIPLWLRRILTMIPTIVIVWAGLNPTQSLFWSQVILSMVLPLPIIALIYFTRRRDLMGNLVNHTATTWIAGIVAGVILVLNLLLLYVSAHTLVPGVPALPGIN